MGIRDLRFAPPVAVTWIAAAILIGLPSAAAALVMPTAIAIALVTSVVVRGRCWGGPLFVAAALIAVLAALVQTGAERRAPAAVRAVKGLAEVTVVIDGDLAPSDRSVSGALRAIRGGNTARPARRDWFVPSGTVPVRVVPDVHGSRLPAGTRFTVEANVVVEPAGAADAFVLFARGAPRGIAEPTGLLSGVNHMRMAFVATTAHLGPPGAGLLRGMVIGDRSGLDQATADAMSITATTHLTAVSGSNCAVLVGLIVLVGRAVRAPRWCTAAAATLVLGVFMVLVRPDPSIVRASIMAVIALATQWFGRPMRGVPLLSVAVISMLIMDPWIARSFAFTLSVLATGGIIVLVPALTTWLECWLWRPVAVAVAVPVCAQALCWPVTVLLSPTVPVYAVPVNLLVEPLVPIVTVVGLLACVAAVVLPWAAGTIAAVAWIPATGVAWVAHRGAALPSASVPWESGVIGALSAAVVAALFSAAVLTRHSRWRRRLHGAWATVLIGGMLAAFVPPIVVRITLPANWTIAMCDVGQGDATVLRDHDTAMLVDTGDDPERLERCLRLLGINRIALLVLTHFDRDHVGAVGTIADRVDRALVGPYGREQDRAVTSAIERSGARVLRASTDTSGAIGAEQWRVLWPQPETGLSGNAASLVIRVDPPASGGLSAVLLGDLGEREQRRLVTADTEHRAADVDVVKVSHHGSADQDPGLYRRLRARVGLIGVGENRYGHPTARALSILGEVHTAVLRTDRLGTIVIAPGPQSGSDPVVWAEHR